MLKLEDRLDQGWAVTETTPKSGDLRNDVMGMGLSFNSMQFSCQQADFISKDIFFDQCLKAFGIVCDALEIDTLFSPSCRVFLQKGFGGEQEAAAQIQLIGMKLATVNPKTSDFLGGGLTALDLVAITEETGKFFGALCTRRRRLEAKVIRQLRQARIDDRLLSRVRLLPQKQREAMEALGALRNKIPEVSPVAIQFGLECSCEGEFPRKDFDLPNFLIDTFDWAEKFPRII